MKILQVIPNLKVGGAQKLLEYLLPYLSRNNEVKIVTFQKNDSEIEKIIEAQGITIYSLNIGLRSAKAPFKLRKFIKWADVVHAHLFPAHYYCVIGNVGVNRPIVFTEHSTFNKRRNHKWLRPVEKFFYGHINHIAAISQATKDALIYWIGEKDFKNKITVIENGVNIEKYSMMLQSSKIIDLYDRAGIPILMISRFTNSKDHATLIRALKYIENPDVFVAFAGDGETRTEMEILTEQLGLVDRVVFLGSRNDTPKLIKSAKVGVQSSHWEGFGLTAIEMMAGELPVVASDVEGLAGVVEGAGILFEKGNSQQLGDMINKILSDPALYKKLQSDGKRRADLYSIKKNADKYLSLYRSLLIE